MQVWVDVANASVACIGEGTMTPDDAREVARLLVLGAVMAEDLAIAEAARNEKVMGGRT